MKSASYNHKITPLLLFLVFITCLPILSSCVAVSPDTADKIKSQAQDLQNKVNQAINQALPQTETGANQASPQLSPSIATVQYIGVDVPPYVPVYAGEEHYIYVTLKPTNIAVANISYVADLYEKGTLRQSIAFTWNQPEINVLKENTLEFNCTQQEFDAYTREDISHVFSVKVHE